MFEMLWYVLFRKSPKLRERGVDPETLFPGSVLGVPRVEAEMGLAIAEETKERWESDSFGGTVGSIFLKLGEMQRRFETCSPQETTILRTLQTLHCCGLYRENQTLGGAENS